MRLLIVEDDLDLAGALATGFRDEGFAVDVARSGPEGFAAASTDEYDIVVLDLALPGMDGLTVLERLRRQGQRVPILILSARSDVAQRVRGLKLGADDYVCKPFSFEELLARARVLLRRSAGAARNVIRAGRLELDLDRRLVAWDGTALALTPKEYALLEALLLEKGKVLTRTRLVQHVYDDSFDFDSNLIDVHIAHLRRKLREATGKNLIATVRGVGFVLSLDPG